MFVFSSRRWKQQHFVIFVLILVSASIMFYVLTYLLHEYNEGLSSVLSKTSSEDNDNSDNPRLGRHIYISVKFQGGIGNQMFQFAFLYGLSKKYNYTVVLPRETLLRQAFGVAADNMKYISAKRAPYITYVKRDTRNCAFDPQLAVPLDQSTHFDGYFQSWKYFYDYADDVRRIFRFTSKIRETAESLINNAYFNYRKISSEKPILIGLHVRRGDLLKTHNANYGYRVADEKYVFDAMNFYRKKFKNVLFLVGTNSRLWVTKLLSSEKDVYLLPRNTAQIDMAILSLTNHTITSVGTFGWWIAFLANGQNVYFKFPFRSGSALEKEFDENGKTFFYKGWIGL